MYSDFYENIDEEFNKLFEKYGLTKDIVEIKQNVVKIFEKKYNIRQDELITKLTEKRYIIDNEGNIKSC